MKLRNSSSGTPRLVAVASMFCSTKSSRPRARDRSQQADVVLAEHLAGEEGEEEAELLVAYAAIDDARQRAARGVLAALRVRDDLLHAAEQLLEGRHVEVDPLDAIDHRGHLERRRQLRSDPSATSGSMRSSVSR